MRTRLICGTLLAGMCLATLPLTIAGAAPVTHEVEFGEFTTTVAGEVLSSFPATLKVHSGDVIHFRNELGKVPDTGVHWAALLPQGEVPDAWMRDEGAIPEGPWSLFVVDPDEDPTEAPAAWKANGRIGLSTHPYCGQTETNPCDFDGSGDSVGGVMTSGLGQGQESYLDFYVRITAASGTELWALCPFHPTIKLRILVVDEGEAVTTAEEIEADRTVALERWDTKALTLHRRYRTLQVGRPGPGDSTVWHAWPGRPSGPLFLVGMYPRTLRVQRGDYVRWHSSGNELHTVSFPMGEVLQIPWNQIRCDPDTDDGTAEDIDPVFPGPPYCPGGGTQLEIDLDHSVPFAIGNGSISGPNDFEVSGLRSTNYGGIERSAYVLRFRSRPSPERLGYVCSLHPRMRGWVVVQ